ncbi:MAG: class I SAM-dependent RNA methyltransferase [Acidobacteriota bacterium]
MSDDDPKSSRGGRPGRRPARPRDDDGPSWGERPRRPAGPRDDRPRDNPWPSRPPRGAYRREDERGAPARKPAKPSAAERLADVDHLELRVEKIVAGGEGLARFEGIPIFIPRSAPGDRLRVRVTERKSGFGRAEITEILEPGPDRRDAPCPHYDACGGCDLQHLDEKAQLKAKAAALVETLRRIGGVKELPKRFQIVAGDPWGYRLRTQLHVETDERGAQAGYFARGSNDLVPVAACPILMPQLERTVRRLPRLLRTGPTPQRFDLAAGDDGAFTCSPPHGKLPQGEVSIRIGAFTYEYDARCFFQAHFSLTERLVTEAMGDAVLAGDADDPEARGGAAFDLYAGVGLFALPLSQRYDTVTAIDGDRVAIRFAKRNARQNGRGHVETVAQAVESWIPNLPDRAERVLVDPPRAGLSGKVRGFLAARKPRRLTYVSCEPATLARDLKYLRRLFDIESLTLLDMFPQTGHMESVVQLRRRDD